MTDLLDRLRDADPVDRETVEIPARLRQRVLTPPGRRRRRRGPFLLAAGGLAVAMAIVLLLNAGTGSRSGLDLADRAYAAASAPGIIHWRTEVETRTDGRAGPRQRIEGWSRGRVQHIIYSDVRNGRAILTSEQRIDGRRMRAFVSSVNRYVNSTAPSAKVTTAVGLLPPGDPMKAFRDAYRIGALKPAGPNRYAVQRTEPSPAVQRQSTTYELDPETAQPVRLVFVTDVFPRGGGDRVRRSVVTLRFAVYEQLRDSAANRALLRMLPHPRAAR